MIRHVQTLSTARAEPTGPSSCVEPADDRPDIPLATTFILTFGKGERSVRLLSSRPEVWSSGAGSYNKSSARNNANSAYLLLYCATNAAHTCVNAMTCADIHVTDCQLVRALLPWYADFARRIRFEDFHRIGHCAYTRAIHNSELVSADFGQFVQASGNDSLTLTAQALCTQAT